MALAFADLAGDGAADLLAANSAVGATRGPLVVPGLGAGVWGPPTPLPGARPVADLVVADLDGDGILDVAASSSTPPDTLFVWSGAEPLGPPGPIGSLDEPADRLEIADLDGDGDPDLVVTRPLATVVVVARGWAGWDPPVEIAAAVDAAAARAADVDGDGDLDLVVASRFDVDVRWVENLGAGAFGASRTVAGGWTTADDLAIADLDGDGDPDVVGTVPSDRSVVAWDNLGGGAFAPGRVLVEALYRPLRVEAADLDGDVDRDLVVRADSEPSLAWLENSGDGSFAPIRSISSYYGLSGDLGVGDADGDGDLDVAGANGFSMEVSWFENATFADADRDGLSDAHELTLGTDPGASDSDGGGAPDGQELRFGTSPVDPLDDGAADRDADGATDAEEAVAGTDPLGFDGDGDGASDGRELDAGTDPLRADTDGDGFSDGQELACGGHALDPTTADADCDGLTDAEEAALGTDPTRADTDGDGLDDPDEAPNGTDPLDADSDDGGTSDGEEVATGRDPHLAADDWERRVVSTLPDAQSVAAVDLDADGDLDVAALYVSASREGLPALVWFENLGGGAFGVMRILVDPARRTAPAIAADLDGDGLEDLVTAASFGDVSWFRSGDRPLAERPLPLGPSVLSLDAADADADGDLDVLAGDRRGGVRWLQNHGAEAFEWSEGADLGHPVIAVRAADLDGDPATTDAVALLRAGGLVRLDGSGPGRLVAHEVAACQGDVAVTTTADLDVDGDPDLVVACDRDGADLAWSPNRGGDFPDPPTPVAPLVGRPLAIAAEDLDGDGPDDVVVGTSAGLFALVATGGVPAQWTVTADVPVRVALADLDGDGTRDVLASSDAGLAWYRNALPPGIDTPPEPVDDTATTATTATTADTGSPPEPNAPPPVRPGGGCGCQPPTAPSAGWALLLPPLALAARRRAPSRRISGRLCGRPVCSLGIRGLVRPHARRSADTTRATLRSGATPSSRCLGS